MELYELLEGCTQAENRDLHSKSDLSALLSAIASAEKRWAESGISVEIFSDGSGWLQRDRRPAMEFTTIDKCFELLSR